MMQWYNSLELSMPMAGAYTVFPFMLCGRFLATSTYFLESVVDRNERKYRVKSATRKNVYQRRTGEVGRGSIVTYLQCITRSNS